MKRQGEDPESQVSVAINGTWSSLSQEMLQIPTNDFRFKEKVTLRLDSLNDTKARYESNKTFLSNVVEKK